MFKPGQSSLRRILLSRILLVSVLVLLIGEAAVFIKVRSSLLETARWNLTESAVRKGESIGNAIAALKANLFMASQTTVLQSGTAKEAQQFIAQLAPQLPTHVQCVQLTNLKTGKIIATTCSHNASKELAAFYSDLNSARANARWPQQQPSTDLPLWVEQLGSSGLTSPQAQLQLLLSAPVYNSAGQLRYALSIQSALHQQQRAQPGTLADSTLVIAENGTILAHPFQPVGRNIQPEADAERLQRIVKNAMAAPTPRAYARRQDFSHLYLDQLELLAGYTAIPSPITNEPDQHWIILAVTDLDNALFGLQEIKIILFVLTVGLLGASVLTTLYLARELGRPLEEFRDYALNLQSRHAAKRVTHNFKIREFDQLAETLDRMVKQLKASAEEIETACVSSQAANQLKSEFLATTSHELRTPLNAIIGCVRLVRDGCCDHRQEEMEFLDRADQAAMHLLGIINEFLDIAKIEAGNLCLVTELIDLRQVIKEVINLQLVHIQQKGLQLVSPDYLEPILVEADAAKLKQVLINVVGNAVKFTEQGSITIKMRIVPVTDNFNNSGTRVVVTVKDTGVGIEPAQQHKLFRPFVMVDGTTTRKFGGTGLGLAISRNLIELMGGSITLSSAGSGQGTTVAIAMPVLNVSPQPSPSRVNLGVSASVAKRLPEALASAKD